MCAHVIADEKSSLLVMSSALFRRVRPCFAASPTIALPVERCEKRRTRVQCAQQSACLALAATGRHRGRVPRAGTDSTGLAF